jgi:O-antigen ligase
MLLKDLFARHTRRPVALFALLLVAAAMTGGSNRADVLSITVVRLAALLAMAGAIAWMPPVRTASVKPPLLMLGVLAGWMTLQLVPLPPAVWTALPGRERLAATAVALGEPQPWMSISIVPLRTLGSLLSLSVPAAALLLVAWLPRPSRPVQIAALIAVGLLSGLLAIVQLSGAEDSAWYFYDVRQKGGAVGFFANRNHQAALLGCMFPMLAALGIATVRRPGRDRKSRDRDLVVIVSCIAAALFILPLIFITGSRAGLALVPVSLAGTALLVGLSMRGVRLPRRWLFGIVGAAVLVGGGLLAALFSGRALSMQRLVATDVGEERRVRIVDPILDLVRQNLPVGSGYGTFDPAFRALEPYSQLYRTYLNHAHSDPLEFVSDGGLPAAAILLAFLLWWLRAAFLVWFRRDDAIARAASIGSALLMLASLVDYPMRTPLGMAVFAMFVGWMALEVHRGSTIDETVEAEPEATPGRERRRRRRS